MRPLIGVPMMAQDMKFVEVDPNTFIRATFMVAVPHSSRVYKGRGQRKNRRDKAGRAIHTLKVEDDRAGRTPHFKCAR